MYQFKVTLDNKFCVYFRFYCWGHIKSICEDKKCFIFERGPAPSVLQVLLLSGYNSLSLSLYFLSIFPLSLSLSFVFSLLICLSSLSFFLSLSISFSLFISLLSLYFLLSLSFFSAATNRLIPLCSTNLCSSLKKYFSSWKVVSFLEILQKRLNNRVYAKHVEDCKNSHIFVVGAGKSL